MYSIWSFFTKKKYFSFLLLFALILIGVFSVIQIKKESAPEVQIPVAIVSTPLPAASAADVEELVTDPIEEHLNNNLENVNTITSSSREGVSVVTVEFSASADIDESVRSVKDEIDTVTPDLPDDAGDPNVSEVNFVDQPIMTVSITSDRALTDFVSLAETIEGELERVPGVSGVSKSGVREREVQVVLDSAALHRYGLNISEVVAAISSANSAVPVGSLDIDGVEYALQFEGGIDDLFAVEDIPVATRGGGVVYVRDLAFVSNGLEEPASYSRLSTHGSPPRQAATFSITKTTAADVTTVAAAVRDKIDELEQDILADSAVEIVFDSGELVREDLVRLSLTGLQTILLVMAVLFVALGWREAVVAGLAIPLSFLIAFIGLHATGNTINFVSLFSLILAVGILVDSAIVITESIHTKLARGASRTQAALASIKEFHTPLTSGVMTTVAVFFPLFFISGVTGKFIASIPFTIITVLLASLFVALGMIPLLSATFLRRQTEDSGFMERVEEYTARFQRWYRRKLDAFLADVKLQDTAMMVLGVLFIISILLPVVGGVSVIFFPQDDSDFLFVDMEMPAATTLDRTDDAVRAVEDRLLDKEYIESFSTTVGALSAFQDGTSGSEYANVTVLLDEGRGQSSSEIRRRLEEELGGVVDPSADIRIFEQSSGPPTGAPINIVVSGNRIEDISKAARDIRGTLEDIPGAINVRTDLEQEGVDFVLHPDREQIARLNLSVTQVAQTLRSAISGVEATTVRTDGNDVSVVVKTALNPDFNSVAKTNAATIDAVKNIEIHTPAGGVLLGSLLESDIAQKNAVIRHEDLSRVASISAEVTPDTVAGEVLNRFDRQFDEDTLPAGVRMSIGGESEDVDQSFRDMFFALIYGLLLILAILMLQFNSFRDMFYIMGIIPFMLIGILLGLAITGLPLSFPSIMGFIALAGIVVNNSIILIDTMNRLQEKKGTNLKETVLEGAELRLRPIVLTTATTVIGVIPLTYASALWGPLAFAIIFGLSFSLVLTLFVVPMAYYRWPPEGTGGGDGEVVSVASE